MKLIFRSSLTAFFFQQLTHNHTDFLQCLSAVGLYELYCDTGNSELQKRQHNSNKARCYLYFFIINFIGSLVLFPVTEVRIKADGVIINGLYFPTCERQCRFSYQLKFYLEQNYLRENHILHFAIGSKTTGRCIFPKEQCGVGSGMDLKAF